MTLTDVSEILLKCLESLRKSEATLCERNLSPRPQMQAEPPSHKEETKYKTTSRTVSGLI